MIRTLPRRRVRRGKVAVERKPPRCKLEGAQWLKGPVMRGPAAAANDSNTVPRPPGPWHGSSEVSNAQTYEQLRKLNFAVAPWQVHDPDDEYELGITN